MPDTVLIDIWFFALVSALWIMLPAYVPNPAAVVLGGGGPIDGGTTWKDGRRLLGDGKTVRGFLLGTLAGIAVGGVEMYTRALLAWTFLPRLTLPIVVALAAGALLGDLAKSFFKRRLGKGQGEPWPVADQYDLVAGALVLAALVDLPFLLANLTLPVVVWILLLTPVLHRLTNMVGHRLGVKAVPW